MSALAALKPMISSGLTNIVMSKILGVVYDPRIIEATPPSQGPRQFTVETSAVHPAIARGKVRIWMNTQRPRRTITDLSFNVLEEGRFVNRYQVRVDTQLTAEEAAEIRKSKRLK